MLKALRYLADCCDGVREKDSAGFSRFDANFGKELAYSDRRLTAKQLLAAHKICKKYLRTQLTPAGILLPEDEAAQAVARRKEMEYTAAKQRNETSQNYNTGSAARVIGIKDGLLGVMFPPASPDFRDNLRKIQAIQREVEGLRLLNPTMQKVSFIEDNRNDKTFKYWQCPLEMAERVVQTFPEFKVTPDVLCMINAEVERKAAEQRKIEEAQQLHREHVERLLGVLGNLDEPIGGRTLYQHQKDAIRSIIEWGSGVVAYDMGLGKTFVGCMIGKAYRKAEKCRVIIVGPKTMRSAWVEEAGSTECQIEYFTHDAIPEDIPGEFILIVDECDMYQNTQAKRTKKFLELAWKAECVVPMSGTPARNGRPSGVYPLLLACKNPHVYAELSDGTPADDQIKKLRRKYESRYCAATPTEHSAWDTTGAAFLTEFHGKFVGTPRGILRKLKGDCLDLPEKVRKLVQVPFTDDEARAYRAELQRMWDEHQARVAEKIEEFKTERLPKLLEEDLRAWLRRKFDKKRINDLEELLAQVPDEELTAFKAKTTNTLLKEERQRLAQGDALVALMHYRHTASRAKARAADNIMTTIFDEDAEEELAAAREGRTHSPAQIIVFCEFKDVAEQIAESFGVPVLSGDTPDKQRKAIIDDFQAGETRVFVGIYGAGGVGITLTAAAHGILIGRPWTPGAAFQAEDRIHRIGQKNTVVIQWLQIPTDVNGVDAKMDTMLQKKQKNISMMFDGATEDISANSLEFTQKEALDLFYEATHFIAGKEESEASL